MRTTIGWMERVCDVSVILPVYNGMPALPECLDSLLNQDTGPYGYEIVVVDDGSTDATGEVLDKYAREHPHLRVIHQENSGWPGQPRNAGIEASSGRYVFFTDADDYLPAESLRSQVEFAEQHGSDIVVPMILDGPDAPPRGRIWDSSAIDADRALLFKTFSPQKLFRRAFLDEHALRFPEGFVPLEDGLFLARAYPLARRVSVLADRGYYYKRELDGPESISRRAKPPGPFIESVTGIIDLVREHTTPGEIADEVVLDLYRRKALKYLLPDRFLNYRQSRQHAWVAAVGELAQRRIPAELEARLPLQARLRSRAARTGDVDLVGAMARALGRDGLDAELSSAGVRIALPGSPATEPIDVTGAVSATSSLVSVRSTRRGYRMVVDVTTWPLVLHGACYRLLLRKREGTAPAIEVDLRGVRLGGEASEDRAGIRAQGFVSAAQLGVGKRDPWDVYVHVGADGAAKPAGEVRLQGPRGRGRDALPERASVSMWRVEPYLTDRGNISFTRQATAGDQPTRRSAVTIPRPARLLDLAGQLRDAAPRLRQQLGARWRDRLRPALSGGSVRQVARKAATGALARLKLHTYHIGPGTAVVSRRSDLHASPVESGTTVVSTRGAYTSTRVNGLGPVFTRESVTVQQLGPGAGLVVDPERAREHTHEIHKALHKRMTNEHVASILQAYGVDCVLDVGANKGQYALDLRKAGYTGHILSFEPVPEMFEQLERRAAKDPKWTAHHCALGREEGTVEMHVVAGSMSSVLPPSEYGNRRYKRFRDVQTVEVPLRRLEYSLDEFLPEGLDAPRVYLKLDTQGYDVEVFAGLGERVHEVVGMQSEVALLQIYEGMPRLTEAVETFEGAGFEITGMFPVTRETDTGRVLEFDCVLARAAARS